MQNIDFINNTQKFLIRVYFENDIFENLSNITKDPNVMIRALNAMIVDEKLGKKKIRFFKKLEIWEPILMARRILAHPCPQNRIISSVWVSQPRKNFVYYQTEAGEIASEQQGFFNLTIRNDDTTQPINRESVVRYIKYLIQMEIERYQTELELNLKDEEDSKCDTELLTFSQALCFSSSNDPQDALFEEKELSDSITNDEEPDFDLGLPDTSCMRRIYNRLSYCSIS